MYPYLLTIGLAGALLWLSFVEPLRSIELEESSRLSGQRLDAAVAAVICGLLLSRLTFVALHFDQYLGDPLSALAFWQGGLTGWGAAIGGLLGCAGFCAWRRTDFWSQLDALAAPATVIAFASWLGCLLDGCAYGRSAPGAWLALPSPDLTGQIQPRWPTQSAGSIISIGLLAGAFYSRWHGWQPGLTGLILWQCHGLVLLLLSWLRADPVRYFGNLRSDTLGAALMLLIGIFLLLMRRSRRLETG